MLIYLAAAYDRREEMQGVRDVLTALGHTITSRWIDQQVSGQTQALGTAELDADPMTGMQYARMDLADVGRAEVLIMFSGGGRGGRHTEFGYALAKNKYLIGVGPREHVFHTLTSEWYPDWPQLVMAISGPHPLSGLLGLPPVPASSMDARVLAARLGAYQEDEPHSRNGGDGPDLRDYQDEMEHPHGYWEAGDYP